MQAAKRLALSAGVAAGVAALLYYWLFVRKQRKLSSKSSRTPQRRDIPGMKPSHEEFGNLGDLGAAGGLHLFLRQLHNQYGPIASFYWMKQLTVSVCSAESWRDVSHLFDRPRVLFDGFSPLIGDRSVQYANGDHGRALHRMFTKSFVRSHVAELMPTFAQIAEVSASSFSDGDIIDVEAEMMNLAVKGIFAAAFGITDQHDKHSAESTMKLRDAYFSVWHELEAQLIGGQTIEKGSQREKEFNQALQNVRGEMKQILVNENKGGEFLHRLHDESKVLGLESEDSQVDQLVTAWVGGTHTTGLLLTWLLYFLARSPESQEKIRQELADVVGDAPISAEHLSQLDYLRWCIDETLRLSVLAPWGGRISDKAERVGEFEIPANTPILLPFGLLLEDESLWTHADEFRPERFSPEATRERQQSHGRIVFSPFGFAGKRICPGQRLVPFEVAAFLFVLLRKFRFELADPDFNGGKMVGKEFGLVTRPAKTIRLTVREIAA